MSIDLSYLLGCVDPPRVEANNLNVKKKKKKRTSFRRFDTSARHRYAQRQGGMERYGTEFYYSTNTASHETNQHVHCPF